MDQLELMRVVVRALEELHISYFVTGSMASIHYGEHRLTHDIDIVVDLTLEKAAALCRKFPDSDYYVREDAARDAVAEPVQHHPSGVGP